jgi:hypothetical protein
LSSLNPNQFDDYRINHRAPGHTEGYDSATFDNPQDMLPDVHERPEIYEFHHPPMHESVRQLRAARGNPEADVTVYRAVPKGVAHIHPGDWVASARAYAEGHNRSELDGKGTVIKATTKAKHLYNEGYLHEWGYQGPTSLRGA